MMRIDGRLHKAKNWWAVEIPLLLIHTQGKTKKEAHEMAKDAIESLIDEPGFEVTIFPEKGNAFSVGASNESLMLAFALKQQRAQHHLSIREVAKRLGSDSPSAYSRYETGKVKPGLDKFTKILKAIDDTLTPVLRIV
jgi:predicted RNase H-like HicB family nuclease/DNA-binding XRE family transcriptional regulator